MFTQDMSLENRVAELERKMDDRTATYFRVFASGTQYSVPSTTRQRYVWNTLSVDYPERFARGTMATANDCVEIHSSGLYLIVGNVLQGGVTAQVRGDGNLYINGVAVDNSLGDATADGYVKHCVFYFGQLAVGDQIAIEVATGSAFATPPYSALMGVYLGP